MIPAGCHLIGRVISKGSSDGRAVYEGPKGGMFHLTPANKKVYINQGSIKRLE